MQYNRNGFEIIFFDDEVDVDQFRMMSDEELLGLVLHGQQQGVNKVFYKGYHVLAAAMEDTSGATVQPETKLKLTFKLSYKDFGSLTPVEDIG